MKVSKAWLKELVNLNVDIREVERLLALRTIATKEITDEFIELDMKGYNRADLLSMRGIAYEVAAITGSTVNFEEKSEAEFEWRDKNYPKLSVTIENDNLCPVYCVAKVQGLKVEQSNEIWIKKLSDSGIKSVNNIVDITNLVMLEYGQPLHAFDADTVAGEAIIVRSAKDGERLITLDEKARELTANDILIADSEKILGLAGVMGGKSSEVTGSTTSIILEAAIFDPIHLRKTANRLGLNSEASKRFIHGLTKKRLLQAFNEAIKMYQELDGKVTALTIFGETTDTRPKVPLTQTKTDSLIGVRVEGELIEKYLQDLRFDTTREGNGKWVVTPPYWRLDVAIEEDLIEEVARMYGYERIPTKPLEGQLPDRVDQSLFELISQLKHKLVDLGLTEVQTYSFYSTEVLNNLSWDKDELIKIANPISSETEYMRKDIWPNLLEVISKNYRRGFTDIAIFEIGKTFELDEKNNPQESFRLSISLYSNSGNPVPELFSILNKLKPGTKLEDIKVVDGERGEYEDKYFHPKRFAFLGESTPLGGIAEVHPRYSDNFGVKNRVAVLELEFEPLLK